MLSFCTSINVSLRSWRQRLVAFVFFFFGSTVWLKAKPQALVPLVYASRCFDPLAYSNCYGTRDMDNTGHLPWNFKVDKEWMGNSSYASERQLVAGRILNMSDRLSPDKVVIDIGAGFAGLRHVIRNASYLAVDSLRRVDPSVPFARCDINALQFPFVPREQHGQVTFAFLGSFEYIIDKVSVLRLIHYMRGHVIMHYLVGKHSNVNSEAVRWVTVLDYPVAVLHILLVRFVTDLANLAGTHRFHYVDSGQAQEARQFENIVTS